MPQKKTKRVSLNLVDQFVSRLVYSLIHLFPPCLIPRKMLTSFKTLRPKYNQVLTSLSQFQLLPLPRIDLLRTFFSLVFVAPPLLRSIQDILKSVSRLPYEKRVDERDEARCASSVELGYSTSTLDRKPSDSPYHVCAELGRLRRALDINILHPNSFDEICVDFVWMPLAYLASGILSPNFFFSSLSLFAGILRYNCCIYIPGNDLVFRSIILNWTGRKVASLLKSSFYVLLDLSKPSTKSYWSGLLPPCPFTNSERTASTCSYYISASLVR
jgi:hypothetical protein